MSDYERIAKVIRSLDQSFTEQPDLTALAKKAGLSPFHFHRLFSSWAGITPKDFLQCLTLTHVKEKLREGRSVLDTALDSGLSGPGRLHDLCVQLEAASPGEIKSGGKGWRIRAGFAPSPFGNCLIAESPRGICHLSFVDSGKSKEAWKELQQEWPQAQWIRSDARAKKLVAGIFKGRVRPSSRSLRVFVKGTAFQVKVWRALLRIPAGKLVAYGNIAKAAGHSKAVRAAGTAVGDNPVAFLIPCHRVIRETGVIGQYRWGRERKSAILGWEFVRFWEQSLDRLENYLNKEKKKESGR